MREPVLLTVTHARLRALQGDAAGAVRILKALLARRPGDPEAQALLANLPGGPSAEPEAAEPMAPPPTPARARELADAFRRTLAPPPPPVQKGRLLRFLAAVTRRAR